LISIVVVFNPTISLSNIFKASKSISAAITLNPKAERATIVALSIPFAAPVTKATLFLKLNSI